MKNTFKLFGIMLLASATMFVACDPEETTPEKTTYTITAVANDAAMGTVTGGGVVDSGATVTLQAVANAGYEFVNWTTPEGTSANNPLVFVATASGTYTANFTEEQGVKTTFGDNIWNAGYVNALYYASQNAIVMGCAQTSSTSYPQIAIQYIADAAITVGTYQGSAEVTNSVTFNGPRVWYYENEEDFVTINYQDGTSVNAGDWWDKTMTLNITAFDATAMNISFTINATMGKVVDVLNGTSWSAATERALTVQAAKVQMTASKSALANKSVAKISK